MQETASISLAALDLINDGCMLFNPQGHLIYANVASRALFGAGLACWTGLTPADFLPAELAAEVQARLDGPFHDDKCETFSIRLGSGEAERHFHIKCCPLGECRAVMLEDTSESSALKGHIRKIEGRQRELESTMKMSGELLRNSNLEMNRFLEELRRKNAELAEATRLKSEFAANTSHELRTPLNGIIGSLSLIVDGLCDTQDERDQYTHDALTKAKKLLELINELIEISDIDSGRISPDMDEVDASILFDDLLMMLGPRAQSAHLSLKFHVEDSARAHARSNIDALRKVLTNLIENAIKFTPSGGSIEVTVGAYPEDEKTLLFSVEDTGTGIPEEYHEKVFEKFFQMDGSSTRRFEGTGLGLPLCKGLVEALGGSIWIVKGQKGRGTTICFTQSVYVPAAEAAIEAIELENATDEENLLPDSF